MAITLEEKRLRDKIRQRERRRRGYVNIAPSHEVPSEIELRPVPGFDGYFAGSDGTIWSRRNYQGGLREKYRMLTPQKDKDGYLTIGMLKDRKHSYRRLAHVILISFVGPCPEGMEACHFPDSSTTNNKPSNLKWATHKENIGHKLIHGTIARGVRHGMAKLTYSEVVEVKEARSQGLTFREIGERFGISGSHACSLCSGKYRKYGV